MPFLSFFIFSSATFIKVFFVMNNSTLPLSSDLIDCNCGAGRFSMFTIPTIGYSLLNFTISFTVFFLKSDTCTILFEHYSIFYLIVHNCLFYHWFNFTSLSHPCMEKIFLFPETSNFCTQVSFFRVLLFLIIIARFLFSPLLSFWVFALFSFLLAFQAIPALAFPAQLVPDSALALPLFLLSWIFLFFPWLRLPALFPGPSQRQAPL